MKDSAIKMTLRDRPKKQRMEKRRSTRSGLGTLTADDFNDVDIEYERFAKEEVEKEYKKLEQERMLYAETCADLAELG